MDDPKVEKWDVFISHASEDKESFVEPLASALSAFGVNVWYDKYALKLGDSLSRSIDRGLAQSDYGLVILSPLFLAKKWPEYELRGLTARELVEGKVILPIWHNITKAELLRFSPTLADKLAVDSAGSTPVQIAVQVIRVIRPDILIQIHRRIAHYLSLKDAKKESLARSEFWPAPIQHETLPPELVGRIRLIRACLLGASTHSMDFWMDGFKRDSHPSKEISYWEHVAAVYREYGAMAPPLSREQHEQVVHFIFALSITSDADDLRKRCEGLPEGAFEILTNLYRHAEPVYDIEEKLPFEEVEPHSEEVVELFKGLDKELFPADLPEELIRELMGTTEQDPGGDA